MGSTGIVSQDDQGGKSEEKSEHSTVKGSQTSFTQMRREPIDLVQVEPLMQPMLKRTFIAVVKNGKA